MYVQFTSCVCGVASMKTLWNDEKCFLFHLKNFLRSSHIYIFVLNFLIMQEKDLIRKLRLFSKFITSSTRKQIIRTHIFPNISKSKSNETWEIFFFKYHNDKKAERLVPEHFWLSIAIKANCAKLQTVNFVYDFPRKWFLMFSYINWLKFIIWLLLNMRYWAIYAL